MLQPLTLSVIQIRESIKILEGAMKPKHVFRSVSLITGVLLVIFGLLDGYNNWLQYLDAQWLLGAGVALIALAARKSGLQKG